MTAEMMLPLGAAVMWLIHVVIQIGIVFQLQEMIETVKLTNVHPSAEEMQKLRQTVDFQRKRIVLLGAERKEATE